MSNTDDFDVLTQVLPINEKIEQEIARLRGEGWEVAPGTVPVAVYQLRRARGLGGRGGIAIDESKVTVIKANST